MRKIVVVVVHLVGEDVERGWCAAASSSVVFCEAADVVLSWMLSFNLKARHLWLGCVAGVVGINDE